MVNKTKRITPPESSAADAALRWSVEQRQVFIAQRLFWLGEVNRGDLVRRFGVSLGQASTDINRFLAGEPAGVSYDKSAKRYVAGDDFRPPPEDAGAKRFLGELRLVDLGVLAAADTMLGVVPPFDATPLPERAADPVVLRAILRAIRERGALDIAYQSMNRASPGRRTIEPHALAHDGFRWHVRAFDRTNATFRDFVLGRCAKPKPAGAATSSPQDDAGWHAFVELTIAPHPQLSAEQARAIAIDYGIRGKSVTLRVRQTLLFYALRRLGLDVPPDARPPQEQHIVLVNRDEAMAALNRRTEA